MDKHGNGNSTKRVNEKREKEQLIRKLREEKTHKLNQDVVRKY